MGGSNRYPVRTPADLDVAAAVALGRRIVADSAVDPLLEVVWTTSRTAVVAGLADILTGARVAPLDVTTWMITLGDREDDVPADDDALDALVAVVGTDPLDVEWHCGWAGAAGGYNSVRVLGDTDVETSVAVYVNWRNGRADAVAAAIAERSGVELGPAENG